MQACHHDVMATSGSPSSRTTTVRLPDELAEALRNYAFVTGISANDVITAALVEYLQVNARTDMVRAAFEQVLHKHALAFEKLADL